MSGTKLCFIDEDSDGNFYYRELTDADFQALRIENEKILRDQFAISALNGFLSNPCFSEIFNQQDYQRETAQICYELANLMIQIRQYK